MLHIILDAVVDIWNKTYIKLPTSQLEILRENKASLACYVVYLNRQNNVEHSDVKALQYVPTKGAELISLTILRAKVLDKIFCCNSPNQLTLFQRKFGTKITQPKGQFKVIQLQLKR